MLVLECPLLNLFLLWDLTGTKTSLSATTPCKSSLRNSGFQLHKVNRCSKRSNDRLMLVIQPSSIAKDVEYYSKHVLICKFMGMQVVLPFLDLWVHETWNPKCDFDIMLATNNFFMVDFSCVVDRNQSFKGGPYLYNQVHPFIKPWHMGFNSKKEIPSRVPIWVSPLFSFGMLMK
jgi:hypothetical protein